MENREELAEEIKYRARQIDLLHYEIIKIAESAISDFHFLDHKVSTFWDCEESPIGMCIYELDIHGHAEQCRYCNMPEERK